jgi:selenocysteine-specific elongation factor
VRVVATAGHVDHGKSSLVQAVTGTDPDRFPEEKERGLTIDLGFAFATLPSGRVVGFVDVPGHVRFVKNMLAGVGAIDVAVLVVAANEGWMPQTEEHARILELLGVRHGMVALTKAGLVDPDTLELAQLELSEHTTGTVLESWPVVIVDSVSGVGVVEFVEVLDRVLADAPPPLDDARPRLWVDRVFSTRGAGTVVTGTLTGGALAVDDDVTIEPGARHARVRGIESHHERLTHADAGSRVALNLAGIDHHSIARGDAVVRGDQWSTVDTVDVALHVLDGAQLPRRGTLDVHVGSGQRRAQVRLLDDDGRFARVQLDASLPLAPGDHFVLRSSARQTTVGGAEVLDVAPARRGAHAVTRLERQLGERLLDARPWLSVDDVVVLAGTSPAGAGALLDELVARGVARRAGRWVVANDELDRVLTQATAEVDRHHREQPAVAGIERPRLARALGVTGSQLLAALGDAPDLVAEREVVRRVDHRSGAEQEEGRRLLAALEAEPFAPPAAAELGIDAAVVKALVRDGLAVDVDGVLFAASALEEARRLVRGALRERGELTVADVRDVLGSTRKYVVPLVNRFDAEGVTRRRGDVRIPGPRAG